MKKLILLAIPALLLTACQDKTKTINIIAPVGAPAFAFYKYGHAENFETNSVPDNVVTSMTKASSKTVVVIDTVSGVQAINKGAPYKIAANITFGNFYLTSTGHDANGVMEPGDKVVLFGQNKTPDLLFHYLYGNEFDSGVEYVKAVSDAAGVLATGQNAVTGHDIDYVFMAQPAVFATLPKNPTASIYANLQDVYKTKSGGKEMVQASVFIKNSLEKEVGEQFLESLKGDIEEAIATPDVIKDSLADIDDQTVMSVYGTKAQVATAVTKNGNGLGLGFKKALDNKENIESFLSLFGEKGLDAKYYF